jgi:hypothetical protein
MLRIRFLVLLGLCFVAAPVSWADDVGYVDCNSHSEATQVFGKPRKTPEVVANIPCGERFTILVYGFYFSRIQTKDGQVGFIYSSLIAVDRAATSVKQAPALQTAAEKTKVFRTTPIDAQPNEPAPAQTQPSVVQTQPSPAQAIATVPTAAPTTVQTSQAPTPPTSTSAASVPSLPGPDVVQSNLTPSSQPQPTPTQATASRAAATPAAVVTAPATASNVAEAATAVVQPDAAAPAQPQPAQAEPTLAQATPTPAPELAASAPTSPAPVSNVVETTGSVAQPDAAAPAEPQPAPPQPAAPAIRPVDSRTSWEKPLPSVRTAPLIELYGGFAFAKLGSLATGTNMIGGMGSIGWNPKPWLQVVGDTSYNYESSGSTKNVLYGNHYGPRLFLRARSKWGITPFAEGLVGASCSKTTVSGSGGYTSSTGSSLSYKVGGGLDFHPSKHWEIRLLDVDYYRTSFGGGANANNYWISTGFVLRLFGGGAE